MTLSIIRTEPDVLDLLAGSIGRARNARVEAQAILATIDSYAHHFENASANGDRDSQLFLGRLDILRSQLYASTRRVTMLNAAQAAERLRLTKPDGSPRDSAYAVIERAGGRKIAGKWTIAERDLDDYMRGGGR